MLAAGVGGKQGAGLHLDPRKIDMTLCKKEGTGGQPEPEARVSAHGVGSGMELHEG